MQMYDIGYIFMLLIQLRSANSCYMVSFSPWPKPQDRAVRTKK